MLLALLVLQVLLDTDFQQVTTVHRATTGATGGATGSATGATGDATGRLVV